MKRFPIAFAVAAFALMSASAPAVLAQGAPEINGVAINTTVANGNTNAAIGLLTEACQTVGVVGSVGEACDD